MKSWYILDKLDRLGWIIKIKFVTKWFYAKDVHNFGIQFFVYVIGSTPIYPLPIIETLFLLTNTQPRYLVQNAFERIHLLW